MNQSLPPSSEIEPPVEIETGSHPDAAVIWMHGLGADGHDFVPVVPELNVSGAHAVRFVFPHAPKIPVTWNGGYVMRAWYDIIQVENEQRHADEPGIVKSCATVRELIARENARGIPTSRIVLAGFSQGGAMAYSAGLTHPEKLAGIIALSTYIPAPALIDREFQHCNAATPVFAAHGTADNVVPYALGEKARDMLNELGVPVEWKSYPIAHSVNLDEIRDIGRWISALLG